MRRRRVAGWVAIGFVIAFVLLAGTLVFITRTDVGRDVLRRFAIQQIESGIDGRLEVRRVEGDPWTMIRFADVILRDDRGQIFLEADTLATRLSLRGLMRRQIALTDLRLIRPVVLLDRRPGEAWNYERIFRVDPDAVEPTPGPPGWGDWISLHDVIIIDGRVTVRSAWQPSPDLPPAERQAELRAAAAGETRDSIVAVPGGYQNVMSFWQLDAELERVLVAHPDTVGMPIDVRRFSGMVQPFSTPAARVVDLAGALRLANDSLFFAGIDAVLPDSRMAADGVYALHSGDLLLRMHADPVAFADVRWLVPQLPETGGGAINFTLESRGGIHHFAASGMDLRTDGARVQGHLAVVAGDTFRIGDSDLRFAGVRTQLIERFAPDIDLPRTGELSGRLAASGVPAALDVDADVRFDDRRGFVSRVVARGGIGFDDALVFRSLAVELAPLHTDLVRAFAPDLPIGGTLTGTTTLDGSPQQRLAATGDIVHQAAGERSRVTGSAVFATAGAGSAAVDLRVAPLSLATVGRFAPGAGLHNSVTGTVRAEGALSALRVNADLRAAGNGGAIALDGVLDLAAAQTGYDLGARLTDFDLAAVTTRAPAETDLTGTIAAVGRGFEPATMQARVDAELTDSGVDDVGADLVLLRGDIEAGLARVDTAVVRLGDAAAELTGSFGLVAGRSGVLSFTVSADSLEAFASWVEPDTAPAAADPTALAGLPMVQVDTVTVADRAPHVLTDTIAAPGLARGDTLLARDDSLTVRAVRADTAAADSPAVRVAEAAQPEPRLAGSLHAEGTLRGNIERFDLDATATAEDFVYDAYRVEAGRVDVTMVDVRSELADLRLDASLRGVVAAGTAFDSVDARGQYRGMRHGTGDVIVHAFAPDDTEYRADAEFTLAIDRNELRLADLMLRADTVTWQSTGPSTVAWGGGAVEIDGLELVSNADGRIRVDGSIDDTGGSSLDVLAQNVELAQFAALLDPERDMGGRLDLDATLEGTPTSPRLAGRATLLDGHFDGTALPRANATFSYAAGELQAEALLEGEDGPLLEASAVLPVDLRLTGTMPTALPGEVRVDVRADSLPLESLPFVAEQVDDVEGRVRGEFTMRGTFDAPVFDGFIDLDRVALRVVPLGVRFRDVVGVLRLDGDVVRVDSLIGYSRGPIRVHGEIGVTTPAAPAFALELEARDARVIDTDDARLDVDADVTIGGTLAAIEITGDVRTRRGVIYIPELSELGDQDVVSLDDPGTFERADTIFDMERRALERRSPLMERMVVDVAVTIDRDVWVRSTEANVEIYTPRETGPLRIVLNGGEADLALEGTLNTDRGEYEFMSRRFQLTRGAVTFQGAADPDPLVQLAAEHQVQVPGREAFAIRVLLGGTVSQLEITLESTAQPPIPETDLLTFLAFGRDAASLLQAQGSGLTGDGGAGDLVGNVAGMATQQLAAVALEALVSNIETDLMRSLGLDVFRITPADLPPEVFTGSYADVLRGTEIEAGRYVAPRLFVAGQATTALLRPGVRVEYMGPLGVRLETTWKPIYLPTEPTLTDREPRRAGVFGAFLFREWRF